MNLEAQGLLEDLGIREEAINKELMDSAAKSYAAACEAIERKKALGFYAEGEYAVYMSHVHRYSRLFINANDEKETIALIDDTSVRLFGDESTEDDRQNFAAKIYDTQVLETVGVKEFDAWTKTNKEEYTQGFISLYKDMYKYQILGKSLNHYRNLKREFEVTMTKAEALVEAYRQRSHCLVAIAANLRSAGDTEAISMKAYSPEMMEKIKRWVTNNPEVDVQVLTEMAEVTRRESRGN